PLLAELRELEGREWAAVPTAVAEPSPVGPAGQREGENAREIRSPQSGTIVGLSLDATPGDADLMLARAVAAQPAWDALGGAERARLLINASDLFEAHAAEIISLCQREAGKTLMDSVLELREAVDFLRYYACEARMLFSAPQPLPGPTGEQN